MVASKSNPLLQSAWIAAIGILSSAVSFGFAWVSPMEFGEAWIRNTARLSLAWYWGAAILMLVFSEADWLGESWLGRNARRCWLLGIATFWLHLLVAFHYHHHWSHAKAFAHVQAASGFGYGIYVSYFFTLAWTFDGLWWLIRTASYAKRLRWIGYTFHGLMLFIVFNSTVVFETGTIRWIGWMMVASLAIAWGARYFRNARPSIA